MAESARLLLNAAIELIAEKGYERTSAGEIAERAGYSHSMVAARYGSKEALLERIMRDEYEPRMFPRAGDGAGLGRLHGWIGALRAEIRENPELIRAFFTLLFEAAGPIPSLRPWTRDWLSRCAAEAHESLLEGQRLGEVPAHVDVTEESELFVFSGVGFGFRFVFDGDVDAFDGVLERWRQRFTW